MQHKTIIHLLSGGLDSVTMLYDLKRQGHGVHAILFDYHQRHAQELQFAKTHADRLGVMRTTLQLPDLKGLTEEDWVVPFRNPIMLALAVNVAVHAKADTITIGCNRDDQKDFPDTRWEVFDAMNHAIKLSGYNIEICAPYLDWPKQKIAKMARELGIDLNETWTCYIGGNKPCGKCPACVKFEAATK